MHDKEYVYEVATHYEDSTKPFYTLIQALEYFETLNEPATLWDYTGEEAEMIKSNY